MCFINLRNIGGKRLIVKDIIVNRHLIIASQREEVEHCEKLPYILKRIDINPIQLPSDSYDLFNDVITIVCLHNGMAFAGIENGL